MKKEVFWELEDFIREMEPGDSIKKIRAKGKIGFVLKKKSEKPIFLKTGGYGKILV